MRKKISFKQIARLRDVYQVVNYLKDLEMNYDEFMDKEFQEELKKATPFANEAIDLYLHEVAVKRIEDEIAKDGIESVLNEDFKIALIPKKYRSQLFDVAERLEKDGEYDRALKLYERIVNMGVTQANKFNKRYGHEIDDRNTIFYKSKFSYYMCKRKLGIELTENEKQDLDSLVEEDKENILNLSQPGKIRDIDILSGMFSDVEPEDLAFLNEVEDDSDPEKDKITKPKRGITRKRPKELSSSNIFNKIVEKFGGRKNVNLKRGIGNLKGYIWIWCKNRDIVILEKFSDLNSKGKQTQVKNARTYVIHKDANIDIESAASLGKIIEERKRQTSGLKLIEGLNHRGETYFERLDDKIAAVEHASEVIKNFPSMMQEASTDSATPNTIDFSEQPTVNQIQEELQSVEAGLQHEEGNNVGQTSADNNHHENIGNEPTEDVLPKQGEVEIETSTNEISEIAPEAESGESVAEAEPEQSQKVEGNTEENTADTQPELDEKVVDTETTIDENTAILLELTANMGTLDAEYSNIQSQIKNYLQQRDETQKLINDISTMIQNDVQNLLADEMIKKIQEGVSRINAQKSELRAIDKTIENLREQERENRQKRAELKEKFDQTLAKITHGED